MKRKPLSPVFAVDLELVPPKMMSHEKITFHEMEYRSSILWSQKNGSQSSGFSPFQFFCFLAA